jgi:hypothetical protein
MDSYVAGGDDGLVFSEGFRWERGFVKRATRDGRVIRFRIAAQLVNNCLPSTPETLDPISAFTANDSAVQEACRRAWRRAGRLHLVSIEVVREDFG